MSPMSLPVGLLLSIVLVGGACGAPRSSGSPGSAPQPIEQRLNAPTRLTVAFMAEVIGLNSRVRLTGPAVGLEALEELVNAGFAVVSGDGALVPQLAEVVPTVENGLWKVLPDGRMETTWRLKPGAQWHDGAAFTTADAIFATRVDLDRDIPIARHIGYAAVEGVDALDARTVVVRWSRPFIDADRMFTREFASPLPRHLLEDTLAGEKASFFDHPYWTAGYVGTGPFRLREFVPGSHLLLDANESYVLGRPRLDTIEVKVVPDSNTLVASVLAGAIDATLGHSLSVEQAIQVRSQWRNGRVDLAPGNWVTIHPQLMNPTPPIVGDLRFRRALLNAVDREQMVETLQYGASAVAHSFLNPNQPRYREIDQGVIRYPYDPAGAAQVIESLGYSRGGDGFLRGAGGQRLSVELRTTAQYDVQRGAMLAVADFWQRVGIEVETLMVPTQRQRESEYRATFPSFELLNGPPSDVPGLAGLHSSKARVPENAFAGSNYSRYVNPEFDSLIDRYFVTIPTEERVRVLGQIIRHISEHLVSMGLFYNDRPIVVGNRVERMAAPVDRGATQSWNAQEWAVRS